MSSIVMVRAGWPAPLCRDAYNHEHSWSPELTGLACDYCGDELQWVDCNAYQKWCRYVAIRPMLVWLLN